MSLLSLVVPVYNVEDYLEECLASLAGQTLPDLEIICVNDGSTDSSREILARWEERDNRIVVMDKPNGGPSSARNLGIDYATSPYVCFPDADDRLQLDACARIVETFEQTDADVVTFGARCFPEENSYPWLEDALSPRDVIYNSFSTDNLFKESSRLFAWRCACRRKLLLNSAIRFDESLRLGEDQAFLFALYPRARRTVFISDKLYDYRVARKGSLMSGHGDDFAKKMLIHVDVVDAIFHDWERDGLLQRHAAEMISFALDFALYDALKLDEKSYRAVADALRGVLIQRWDEIDVKGMSLSPVSRCMALKACYHPARCRLVRRLLVLGQYVHRYGTASLIRRLLGKKRA